MDRTRLSEAEVASAVVELGDWTGSTDRLTRSLRFADFPTAIGFMAAVAIHAECLDHHPEWRNVYSRVDIELTTHDAGGVTTLDVELARRIDELAARFAADPC